MKAEGLFLVTRSDLDLGSQAAQAAHALRQFVAEHPDEDLRWFRSSNTLVLVVVPNERELQQLANSAFDRNIRTSAFREPDLDLQLTALALEPSSASKKLCRNLRLLGS